MGTLGDEVSTMLLVPQLIFYYMPMSNFHYIHSNGSDTMILAL